MSESSRFIDEEIEVHFAQEPGPPTSFVWRGQEYRVVEVESVYRRLDFKRPWWRRRHRDYYQVKTDTGQVFEIYFHRGPGKRYWVLYKEFIT
jgi:hypothetical protein